jgi:hypothetical protein
MQDPRNVRLLRNCRLIAGALNPTLMAVVSIDRRNTLIFVGKMECWNEIQASAFSFPKSILSYRLVQKKPSGQIYEAALASVYQLLAEHDLR